MRLNWSTLKLLHTSPALLKWRAEHPRPDTPALRLGRAIHCAILEPGAYEDRWISTEPCTATKKSGDVCGNSGTRYLDGVWFCGVKGHAPDGAGDPPAGVEVISPDERGLVAICANRVRTHKVAGKLFTGGNAEKEIEWESENGIACRGRVDYLTSKTVIDLKSTRKETVREFTMDSARNLYHGQLAWYLDGAVAAGRIPEGGELPYVVAVSTAEPYDVMAFQLSKVTYQAGQILYRDLLARYQQCMSADWWPGVAPDLIELDVPNWSAGMDGSESSGDSW